MSGESIVLNGNALDVAFIETSTMSRTMVVAIDNIHKPGLTIDVRDDKVRNKSPALLLRWSLTIVTSMVSNYCRRLEFNSSLNSRAVNGRKMQVWRTHWKASQRQDSKNKWMRKRCETCSTVWRTSGSVQALRISQHLAGNLVTSPVRTMTKM
jgi:hypothetical protein